MNITDERILEVLESKQDAKGPTQLKALGPFHQNTSYISQRLTLLKKVDLVYDIGDGKYKITSKGDEYLSGMDVLKEDSNPKTEE